MDEKKDISTKKIFRRSTIAFILIVLVYFTYAIFFIRRSSFVIDGTRYFSLFDDAMVSMRYARNLANGQGLVWNPGGERVEGFTNPLWVLYMFLLHLLPLAPTKVSLLVQITGLIFLLLNLYFVRKVAQSISSQTNLVSLGAVLLTAFYLPINYWTLQGMEVGALMLITTISIWQTLQCIAERRFSGGLYFLAGIATLIRPDMAVIFFAILSFLVITDAKNRRKNIIYGSLILIFFILVQTIFRLWYFGEVLPNTYYLKMTGYPLLLRIGRGLFVFWSFVWRMNWVLFLLPFSIFFYRRDRQILLLFWVFLAQVMYSIYVGGDAWEWWGGNRYLSVVMPCFFILFSCALFRHLKVLLANLESANKVVKKCRLRYVYLILLSCSLLNFNINDPATIHGSVCGPSSLAEFLLIKPALYVLDAKSKMKQALILRKVTTQQAKIAVTTAGVIPYFSDRYAIDMLGKNDKKIAREKVKLPFTWDRVTDFKPGHSKYDYAYSIGQLQPDVVVELWWPRQEAEPYLDNNYKEVVLSDEFVMYFRNDSSNILWDEIEAL